MSMVLVVDTPLVVTGPLAELLAGLMMEDSPMSAVVPLSELLAGLVTGDSPPPVTVSLAALLAGLMVRDSPPLVMVPAGLEVSMVLSMALGFLWPRGNVFPLLDIASNSLPRANS